MPYKKRRRKLPKDKTDRKKDSLKATIALGFVLANVFQWALFLRTELLLTSGISMILGFIGFFVSYKAKKQIDRHNGTMQGESRAVTAYWANLGFGVFSLLLFSWLVLMGILQGDFL